MADGDGAEGKDSLLGDWIRLNLSFLTLLLSSGRERGRLRWFEGAGKLRVGFDLHAQPTHRRNTTSTGPPRPHTIFLSLSSGASSPTLGISATGTGGWGGASHGCTVMGRAFTDIQAGHGESSSADGARSSFGALEGFEKLKVSEEMPAFLRASFVVRLENIVARASLGAGGGGECGNHSV